MYVEQCSLSLRYFNYTPGTEHMMDAFKRHTYHQGLGVTTKAR